MWSLYQDRQGLLWVGAWGGLSRVDRTARLFTLYPAGSSDPNSIQGGGLRGMYLDRDDVLWIGTKGGVLNRYDRRQGVFTYYRYDEADSNSQPVSAINVIYRDRQGQLWIGGDRGLECLDEETGRFTQYRHDPNDSTSLVRGSIRSIYEDRDGILWVGTTAGLNRFDRVRGTPGSSPGQGFTRYVHDPLNPASLSSSWVLSIYEDAVGTLWIGSADGLNRFDRASETFTRYEHDEDDPQSLNRNIVRGMYERPIEPGILWVATIYGGLDRLDVQTSRFTHYTSQNSDVPSNWIECIFGDEEGRLWMSTDAGIASFDPDTEEFKVFTAKDGLQMLAFNAFSCHQGYNGELFFGGDGGVNAIQPGDVFDNPHPPEVALNGLRLFNEPVIPGPESLLIRSITETKAVTLAHDQNDLTLEYVGLHFRLPEQNQYAYMLEGYDETWREVGTERRAVYTNLPHGPYTFRVKASNSDGVWNETGASLEVTIRPPWWRTLWAYTVYGLLFAAGVFGVDRWQRKRLIAREREKTRERELEQAREIERAYTQLKTTQAQLIQQEKMASLGQLTAGIAHEIKNSLNFVNNFAEINQDFSAEMLAEIEANPELQAEPTTHTPMGNRQNHVSR